MNIINALQALSDEGVAVCHPPYKGGEDTYIEIRHMGQNGDFCAEGAEAESGESYIVTVFSPGYNSALFLRVKALLEAGGFAVSMDGEDYDKDKDCSFVAFLAVHEDADYG